VQAVKYAVVQAWIDQSVKKIYDDALPYAHAMSDYAVEIGLDGGELDWFIEEQTAPTDSTGAVNPFRHVPPELVKGLVRRKRMEGEPC